MAYCARCGAEAAENTALCAKCSSSGAAGAANPSSSDKGELGLDENIAGLLCYAATWVTGLIFFLIDKRPSVRFHAAQSMVVFGGLQVLYIIIAFSAIPGGLYLVRPLQLLGLVLWILLMVKAYQGERFRVPFAADLADSILKM